MSRWRASDLDGLIMAVLEQTLELGSIPDDDLAISPTYVSGNVKAERKNG